MKNPKGDARCAARQEVARRHTWWVMTVPRLFHSDTREAAREVHAKRHPYLTLLPVRGLSWVAVVAAVGWWVFGGAPIGVAVVAAVGWLLARL